MKTLLERAIREKTLVEVPIPNLDGDGIAEVIKIEVEALRDPVSGELFFDGAARRKLDAAKARRMGLLSPEEIRGIRVSMGLSQRLISRLLQIGEKSYTRWETGRDRPSRSLNLLLRAVHDGKIDLAYLYARQIPRANAEFDTAEPTDNKPFVFSMEAADANVGLAA